MHESHFSPFPQTRWSIVVEAGGSQTEGARRAMEDICQSYWKPLYAFIRRNGFSRHDAEDLTQDFLSRLMEKDSLSRVGEEKGKLRTFLLAALKNFITDFRRQQGALKRGGGKVIVSIDKEMAESHFAAEPADGNTPESLFAKHWAQTVLESVFDELETESEAAGKGDQFAVLCPFLQWNSGEGTYVEAGEKLGMKEGAIKVAVYRLRKRYREIFRARIMETVADEKEFDEEIAFFFNALEQ